MLITLVDRHYCIVLGIKPLIEFQLAERTVRALQYASIFDQLFHLF